MKEIKYVREFEEMIGKTIKNIEEDYDKTYVLFTDDSVATLVIDYESPGLSWSNFSMSSSSDRDVLLQFGFITEEEVKEYELKIKQANEEVRKQAEIKKLKELREKYPEI